MTNNISTIPRRLSALVGVVGEYLAAQQLRELGWAVPDDEVFGGLRRHFDLRATAPGGGRSVQVSVKTSTRADGGIAWQKPGMSQVAPWIDTAGGAGEQAIVLGLHVESVAAVQPVPGGFFFPTPRVIEVGALAALDWGREVDAQRAAYGARMRKNGRGLLSPDGLRYPLTVHELDWLDTVLAASRA